MYKRVFVFEDFLVPNCSNLHYKNQLGDNDRLVKFVFDKNLSMNQTELSLATFINKGTIPCTGEKLNDG